MQRHLPNKISFKRTVRASKPDKRAATSIPLLIAEGCGRETSADTRNFFIQARGSSKEIQTALELSKELSFIDIQTYTNLNEKANHVGAMLTNLINKMEGGKNGKSSKKEGSN